ncbi:MAG: hypothetical protein P8Z75_13735 [Gammaproteobacteria bacterium]
MPQTESFVQTFDLSGFRDAPDWLFEDAAAQRHRTKDAFMDAVFTRLVGRRNWQNLKDIYTFESLQQEIESADIYVTGTVNFVVYLDPVRQHQVVLGGSGRYSIVRRKNNEILLSGDFRIVPKRTPIADLYTGTLPVETVFYVTRIPRQTTYYWEAPTMLELSIDTRYKEDGVFAINYSKSHDIYLTNPVASGEKKQVKIGQLVVDGRAHAVKLIDIRMMKFLEDDYKTKLGHIE